jgi:hypothetical protein
VSGVTRTRPGGDRLALTFLMMVLAAGSLALWTVVPLGALWAVSMLDVSSTLHLALAIVAVPAAIILFASVLMRLNALYVRVASSLARHRGDAEDRARYMKGPLEWLVVGSLVVALISLVVWLAFIAEDPFPFTTPTA